MTPPIRMGISTCPNDTFAFHALMNGKVDREGLEFEIELLDIQQLNDQLFKGHFDVAKCSFHAALRLCDSMVVLPSGAALGFGVGPLLLAARENESPTLPSQRTLCPGEHTTATLLFKLFYADSTKIEQVVFSDIMPQLRNATADFGVCIHEGRFTWQQEGLALVEDLGIRWENETRCPLPLGGLVGSRRLPLETLRRVQRVVRASLEYALASPDETLPTMRKYAQEFDDSVLMKHVELYVNDWTVELGEVGARALAMLNTKAKEVGLVGDGAQGVEILGA
ncbi:MAG: 1,4-dihydroxy-6-naphthoate synthase [Planctomycetota bacterium]